jgi:prepilin-type N-terminal cleavage/methylation domain-containing protein
MLKKNKKSKGFSLIEILLSAFIISISAVAALNAYAYLIRAELGSTKYLKAAYLLDEGVEGARYLRDKGWTSYIRTLSTTTTYYLYASTSAGFTDWQTTTTKQTYDGIFERKLTFANVYRDSNQNISSTGTLDTNIMQVSVNVSWLGTNRSTTTKKVSTLIANFYKN